MRHVVMWTATFGGGFLFTGGALAVAGSWVLAGLAFALGAALLTVADLRLRQIERVFQVMYDGPREDDLYVDEAGPFGWIGGTREAA